MPNLLIIALALIIPICLLNHSGKKNEEKFYQERNARPASRQPEHEIVDNQPSSSAWIFAGVVVVVLVLASMHGM